MTSIKERAASFNLATELRHRQSHPCLLRRRQIWANTSWQFSEDSRGKVLMANLLTVTLGGACVNQEALQQQRLPYHTWLKGSRAILLCICRGSFHMQRLCGEPLVLRPCTAPHVSQECQSCHPFCFIGSSPWALSAHDLRQAILRPPLPVTLTTVPWYVFLVALIDAPKYLLVCLFLSSTSMWIPRGQRLTR